MTAPKLPKGHLSCYAQGFKYTPAASTDVAKTFARIKRERKAAEATAAAETHVVSIKRGQHDKR